jgi:riboflavin kinase
MKKERRNIMAAIEKSYLHWPDLQFIDWCSYHYGINRGIYNTIDAWFYAYGILNLTERRRAILQFLKQAGKREGVKFGKGGLTSNLEQFAAYSKGWEHDREIYHQ